MRKQIAWITLLVILAVLVLGISVAQAAPQARPRAAEQVLVTVWIQQGTRNAQVRTGVVALGPLPKRLTVKNFTKGVIFKDDLGRQIGIKGNAVLSTDDPRYQIFDLTDIEIVTKGKKYTNDHLFVGLFDSGDWQHPYEDSVCSSPQLSIEACLAQWVPPDC